MVYAIQIFGSDLIEGEQCLCGVDADTRLFRAFHDLLPGQNMDEAAVWPL